ncbi:MAG TPA: tripartite tricarboxylate transporter substrate-binding protein [Alphaproteobacteria bacterium]|nr:tripartite tricarboxylate transporter substrate-binding protein [Alphaproteobacteria bacterium]
MHRFTLRLRPFLLAAVFAALAIPSARAEDAAAFYRTHTVKFIAGGGPGGGYDTYARMIAPHLGKALGATVVVENQPGAGGLVALNRMYVADPNGLELLIMNGGAAVMSQLFGLSSVKYDLAKVGYIGTASSSPWLVLVQPDSPYKSIADLAKKKGVVRWPATGPIDGLSDGATMVCEAFKIDCRVVLGYRSSSESALAVKRGEMDAMYVSDTSANHYEKAGTVRAIAALSPERSEFFPDIPTVFESKLTPDQKWWLDVRAEVDALGRLMLTSPGVPADRLAYLQAAMKKALSDPALLAEATKSQRYIKYSDPEATRKHALGLIDGMSADEKAKVKTVVMTKYFGDGKK